MKTKAEMNELFLRMFPKLFPIREILDKVEYYSIDHAPIMPTFAIPEDFGTEEEYRKRYTEKDLFDEFTQDENGNVVLDEDAAKAKIKRLGGYDKLYVSNWRPTILPSWHLTVPNGFTVTRCRTK